ncbi:malonate decarboxylase holo-[acyl-carrier-protein] synthase [Xanthomonas campestris pv. campestris]|uniref:malonate decarboxylase holo-[acyl-carrier-protein] synthase n=1 Tax=Xanthomonas campestris TaxID=339 RepID=UPI002378AF01|nr:malonate decarboxylase holo-[acyl-carrier-protein] synthase [Xanthomonas campestris]MDO0864058.1 malonate decarboxylase holo-[acyl-carrier-protein] synthase [Xanthomonas campestris pv. campestris]MEB1203322.1 malonate decarboxylase holo-[acyl-carrier-protein] synthase [Xanthomonas campestris pv. campestris]MEB1240857.1 malonate decarboxylase holo-[acyl-carrier-protein] synthase [Xanthomonas campestris pv. campestris]MEB1485144.1 malonate decarboxylase holo-[acyl-carrier-protein] synthase [Xa
MAGRHALVWLRADAPWQALTPGAKPRLQAWFAAGFPAVVARRAGAEQPGQVRLGVPLPPAEGKQRIALCAQVSDIARSVPALALPEVISHAPPQWQGALHALQAQATAIGMQPRVFGSFAFQAVTGLPYVHAASDVDLLWTLDTPTQAHAVVTLLQQWEHATARRADGELLLPDGNAVNWREYAGGAQQVLVKRNDGCRLLPRTALFPERCAA